ncbi:hypothetical protein SY83_13550 [Paenibacillus swuensis]|uniref:Glycosyl-hydrolase family 116 catalytic region domain-containing protein n=1 Tax=Paenibacillus swuensis TaxID=1178515 RepID=A0A172TJH0_9BACL|nr:GH116 family glycosyl-hydrolase [Paenibacillus swuensis]ANE47116.1 hypothetical protein SY83_13550 [Paenibacillus swuensis]
MSPTKTMASRTVCDWPVLTRYDQDHLRRIALPLGGIGTGTISLGGRGNLQDWEIMNRPAKGFTPRNTFFALYAKAEDQPAVTRVLEGVLDELELDGAHGSTVPNHGLPRFRTCSFEAAYPFGQAVLDDKDVPVSVRLGGFNPLVPGDSDISGIPAAVLRFELTNKTDRTVKASVCGSLENFIGSDGNSGAPNHNRNVFRHQPGVGNDPGVRGMYMYSDGVDPLAEQYGTICLATTEPDVSYSEAWQGWAIKHGWGERLTNFWRMFSETGRLVTNDDRSEQAPVASLAASVELDPYATRTLTFLITWHFPNRQSWDILIKPKVPQANTSCCGGGICVCEPVERVGNYYTTRYSDAWDAAVVTAERLEELEGATIQFVKTFMDTDVPPVVQEAALYNISTLRSQTCFRIEDGHFLGWEGSNAHDGSCHGSATHVWNYESATGFLFGDLARNMRDAEFRYGVTEEGLLNHRLMLPLHRAQEFGVAAADGQCGTIMRLYREWRLSGDDEFLRELWPAAVRALSFCWQEGGWDADQDGVAEGCQHVTYDIEFHGPNPLSGIWYLGALRAMNEMAAYLGEDTLADMCRELFNYGSRWMDENLFNGEYYEQEIRPFDPQLIAPGLQTGEGAVNQQEPEVQLGSGCLTDQLIAQMVAALIGLGDLVDPEHVQRTLQSIRKYNYRADTYEAFNHMRSFVMNDEPSLVICSYPKGDKPAFPFPYYSEAMNGMEYAAAVHMLLVDMTEEGLQVIRDIRSRYDGRKRNPFNEQECGYHYVRSMASWGAILAWTGFQYDGVRHTMTFKSAAERTRWFWSNGSAWGSFEQSPEDEGTVIKLTVMRGMLTLNKLGIKGLGHVDYPASKRLSAGESIADKLVRPI